MKAILKNTKKTVLTLAMALMTTAGTWAQSSGATAITINTITATAGNEDLFCGGLGTPTDPYQICTASQLDSVRYFLDKHFILTQDIDLSAYITTNYTINGWLPIGNNTTSFTGTFNGKGHKVYNLWIDRSGDSYIGLFGAISGVGARIDSLGVEINALKGIIGNGFVGGLVGFTYNANVTTSYTTGTVIGYGNTTGGLVGSNTNATVSNCYSTANVTGNGNFTGGLLGNNVDATLTNCYASGTVSGTYAVGGLVGWNQSNATIKNCVAANSSISLTSATTTYINRIVGYNGAYLYNNYANQTMTVLRNGSPYDISANIALHGASGASKDLETLKTFAFYNTTSHWLNSWSIDVNVNTSKIWRICATESLPYFQWQEGVVCPPQLFCGGKGTLAKPYQICTATQLDSVRYFLDKHFVLINDINILDGTITLDASGWAPIGDNSTNTNTTRFTGTFNGAGHKISNLWINRTTDYAGLFGYISGAGARIDSLGVEINATGIIGKEYVGGLAGVNSAATITQCYTTGNVKGTAGQVGGFVGQNIQNATITNCYTTGNVTGTSNVGGFVGMNAVNSNISYSYAMGSVTGTGSGIGGLVGFNVAGNTIKNCVAANTIVYRNSLSATSINRIAGTNTGALTNNYANSAMMVQNNSGNISIGTIDLNDVTGADTTLAAMKTLNFYALSNWNGSAWNIDNNVNPANIWRICNHATFPFFQWQKDIVTCPPVITATAGANGTITPAGFIVVEMGTDTTFTFTPAMGYHIDGVYINGVNNATAVAAGFYRFFNVIGDSTIHVTFAADANVYIITATATGNGTIAPSGAVAVNDGDDITFTFTPAQGYVVDSLWVDNIYIKDSLTTYTFYDVDDDHTIKVSFRVIFCGGNGTTGNPYKICDAAQLNAVRYFLDKHFVLVNNIDILDGTITLGASGWLPIGDNSTNNNTTRFTGRFNGAGHKITNLWINSATDYVGLFGYISGSTVRIDSLGVEIGAKDIVGKDNVGGIAGYCASSATIAQCYTTGNVRGNTSVGALVGYVSAATISNCYTTGNVTGSSAYLGGLAGICTGASTIINCYVTGDVTGTGMGSYIGGLIGSNLGSTIKNCIAANSALSTGMLTPANFNRVAGASNPAATLLNNYANENMTASKYGGAFHDLSAGSGLNAVGGADISLADLKTLDFYNTSNNWETVWSIDATATATAIWRICNEETLPFFQWQKEIACTVPPFCGGLGTPTDPYQICTASQLDSVRYYLDTHFILAQDIDLSAYISANYATDGWLPIGDSINSFTGTFNGKGFKIYNLRINRPSTDWVGLFGYVYYAKIDSVGIEISPTGSVKGYQRVGGLAGESEHSNVSCCYTTGNITGEYYDVGGLIGRTFDNSTISNCYTTGDVTGSGYVGGLVGANMFGSIIADCYASGNVKSSGNNVGGLVGNNWGASATIRNCVAANDSITGNLGVNRIAGNNSSGNLYNNYANQDMKVNNVNIGGTPAHNSINGGNKTLATLKTFAFYSTPATNWTVWNIDENANASKIWRICDSETFPYFQWQEVACNFISTLDGVVIITGSAIFGEILTANTAGLTSTPPIPDLGTLSYQWKRGATNIGTNSATYTLVQADIASTITVTVTAANCIGSVTSDPTATVSKASQTAPAAPTLLSKTATSITLNTITGCEYRINGGTWQTSTTFSGLTSNTSYSFEARKAETATHLPSPESAAAIFTTDISVASVEITNCSENGVLHLGETLQMLAQVLPENATNPSIIWSSSNLNTATVDQTGTVTALKTGATIITVTTVDGGFTSECYIRVIQPVTGVALNKTAITLQVAGVETLTAALFPENATIKEVVWSSDDETIATVNATGKVTGMAVGNATITVKTVDGNFTATCNVTVVAAYISPTGITLTPTALSLDKDATYTLLATVKPANANPTVTWSSSNATIATVDSDGVVTGKAAGKATITAKTINGYSATCTVTVTIPVESVDVTPAECTIPLKGAKALKATVNPSDATNKTITWSSSNTAIATVNSTGTVTAKSVNGTVEIYATAANGVVGTCTITVGTGKSSPMDAEMDEITVYPNPTNGELRITNYELGITNIEIFDMLGHPVGANLRVCPLRVCPTANDETEINISHLPTGIYFIRIETENGNVITRKIIRD